MPTKNFMQPLQMGWSGASPQAAFAAPAGLNQLVRQEQHLGLIRELVPPSSHIGLKYCPWMEVATDDVVFDYLKGSGSGLAPATAQDAESELFQDVEDITGQMRASVLDWRLKSRYTSSDVMTYREMLTAAGTLTGAGAALPLYVTSVTEGFDARVDRDTAKRRLWLDNRIEWLILTGLSTGKIEYNDGNIIFSVDFERPADQHDELPTSNSGDYSGTAHDPINDILKMKEFMFDRYAVEMTRAICSRKFLNALWKSAKFIPRTGFISGVTSADLPYLTEGWGPSAALEIIERETGVTFEVNDNVFRARNTETGAVTNQRFIPQNQVIFLPSEASIDLYDDTEVGFGKMLTSPHPMGNFTPGFYSWEAEETDPWQHVIGSGVKAFPVFPHMELTFTWLVDLTP